MNRGYANVLAASGTFIGFLGSIAIRVLEAAGLVETALWLHSLTDQTTGLHINWVAVMFDLFVVSGFSLIGLNFGRWRRSIAAWALNRRHSEISAHKAMIWICYWSRLGDAWGPSKKIASALTAMRQAGASGKLTFKGCPAGQYHMVKISCAALSDNVFATYETTDTHAEAVKLVAPGAVGGALFTGITVNSNRVRSLWPSNGRHGFTWTGLAPPLLTDFSPLGLAFGLCGL